MDRAAMVSPKEKIIAVDLAGAIAKAGVDPSLEGRALQNALIGAIADRRGYVDWTVDHAGWVVMLLFPQRQAFYGRKLSEGIARCLV
jgi:hypothetical protein